MDISTLFQFQRAVINGVRRRAGDRSDYTKSEMVAFSDELMKVTMTSPKRENPVTERTIRYYRQRGLIDAPAGNGRGARYGWRHVLQLTAARIAADRGDLTLAELADDRREAAQSDDVLLALFSLSMQDSHPLSYAADGGFLACRTQRSESGDQLHECMSA